MSAWPAAVLERCADCRHICLCRVECVCSVLDGATGDLLCHDCADQRDAS